MFKKAKIEGVTPIPDKPFLRAFRFVRAYGERFRYGKQYHIPGVDANPSKFTTAGLCATIGSDPSQMVVPLFLDEVAKTAEEGSIKIYSTVDGKDVKYFLLITKDGENPPLRVDTGNETPAELAKRGPESIYYGGLIKIEELTAKLNEFIALYNAHTHNGGLVLAPDVSAPVFEREKYENTGIVHGGPPPPPEEV